MNNDSPVTMRRISYRGTVVYHLAWAEGGSMREQTCESEEEGVVAMAKIEGRLKREAMAGQGLTVNPFGEEKPYITSKDVHFAALRLQPRKLVFRDVIQDYVAAATALQGMEVSVGEAAKHYAEASRGLAAFDVSLEQVVFEWIELKKQLGDRPIFELLRPRAEPAAETTTEPPTNAAG